MKKTFNNKAFSLAELLAALLIGSLVLITVLGVFGHIQKSSAKIISRLDESVLPRQILQIITEDIEDTLTNTNNAQITFETKTDLNGYRLGRLEITKSIYSNNKTFETIIWQSAYDLDSDLGGLVLYRKHTGLGLEDRLLGEAMLPQDRDLFIPVCQGVTAFEVQTKRGDNLSDKWASNALPPNIVVSLSFAEPFETETGMLEVPLIKKTIKTIVIDRTKSFKFAIEKKEYDLDANSIGDLTILDPNEGFDSKIPEEEPEDGRKGVADSNNETRKTRLP